MASSAACPPVLNVFECFSPRPAQEDVRSKQEEVLDGYCEHVNAQKGNVLFNTFVRPLEEGVDKTLMQTTRSSLTVLGKITTGGMTDDDMPEPLRSKLASFYTSVWSQYSEGVENELFETHSLKRAHQRKSLAMCWAQNRWLWPKGRRFPAPYEWLRAKVLYHLLPADATFWQVIRSPYFYAVALAQMVPFYGLGIYVFALLFVMINKRDEYQLVSFICRFKAIQFFSMGFLPAVMQSFEHYMCLANIDAGRPEACKSMGGAADTGGMTGARWALAAEPVRICVVWIAFAILASGYSHGGPAQLEALEIVRRDAAGGAIDGVIEDEAAQSGHSARRANTQKAYMLALKALRVEKTSVRSGGLLPYFMVYDVVATLLCVLAFGGLALWSGLSPDNWLFWETMELACMVQALLSLPFVLFILPFGMPLLCNNPRATGYNKQGLLCCALSTTQIHLLRQERKKLSSQVKAVLTDPLLTGANSLGSGIRLAAGSVTTGIGHIRGGHKPKHILV